MRKPLVAGNWKMHGSRAENASLVRSLLDQLRPENRAEVLVCPPFPYLFETGRLLKDTDVALGAQTVCEEAQGAFTGEVSAAMLRDVGVRYVLVGHSERRQLYGESDALVARKFVAAQAQTLVPVLCVGETLEEREGAQTLAVVSRQLEAVLSVAGVAALGQAVIAYEPVWAIGTGRT
ncbi:MAG TPA: triose-phosphate isomerase, partial [Steroidobacteraceae bacterium]|nr:triose-phosphate isomerase [Steroidobacteraceae bacterium]